MLLSMTGFGKATRTNQDETAVVELKTVNHRYFKLTLRMAEVHGVFEPRIEAMLRESIERGAVSVTIKIQRTQRENDYQISEPVLRRYFEQFLAINRSLQAVHGVLPVPRIERLVTLPGVMVANLNDHDDEQERLWELLRQTIEAALADLNRMRQNEGESMKCNLLSNVQALQELIGKTNTLAPQVVEQYHYKLQERIRKLLEKQNVVINDADLVKEVAIFADRCDIAEEIVRFRSHLKQFEDVMQSKERGGRKLDFLTQELVRETNTIGSKANDAEITKYVVEMKTVIERIREMIQNIE